MNFFFEFLATAKFPPEKFQVPDDKKPGPSQPAQPPGPKKIPLNSSDQLYSEIRDLNFLAVGPVLSKKAKQISAAFEVRFGGKFKSLVFVWPDIRKLV